MKGKIFYEGKEFRFANLRSLSIQVDGKSWVCVKYTDTQLNFGVAPMGGYGGMGNYLKQWRKRRRTLRGRSTTQAEAAKIFGVSQSFIAKVEANEKTMPKKMFDEIRRSNQSSFGREKDPYQKE